MEVLNLEVLTYRLSLAMRRCLRASAGAGGCAPRRTPQERTPVGRRHNNHNSSINRNAHKHTHTHATDISCVDPQEMLQSFGQRRRTSEDPSENATERILGNPQ